MKPEIHVFLVYNKARNKEQEIIKRIKDKFKILEIYEIEWSKKKFCNNLERFYCENLRKKVKHSGTGKFLVITVRDNNPQYCYTQTLRREEYVNSNVLFLKQELRMLTSPSEKKILYNVHSTNDTIEVNNNLVFLIGKTYKEYYNYAIDKTFDGKYIQIQKDPCGADGWNDISEIFKLFSSTINYVVLQDVNENTTEVNVLTDNIISAIYVLNGKVYGGKFNKHVKVKIGKKQVVFNLRVLGDDFVCKKWEQDILKNKVLNEKGYYVPDKTDFLYLLMYHFGVHQVKDNERIKDTVYKLISEKENLSEFNFRDMLIRYYGELRQYMDKNDYFPIKPKDEKLAYNLEIFNKVEFIERLKNKYKFSDIKVLDDKKEYYDIYDLYLSAMYDSEKVFIKYGRDEVCAEKEFVVSNYFRSQNEHYFPKALMFRNLDKDIMFEVTEFVEGQPLSKDLIANSDIEKQNRMFDSCYEVAQILYKNKFPHKNLKSENFIVESDGTVKLVDFKYLIGFGFGEDKKSLLYPQSTRQRNKQKRKSPYIWDDMYAMYGILTMFNPDNIKDYDKKMSDIKSLIGKQKYYFFYNNFPLEAYINYKPLIFVKLCNIVLKPLRKLLR